MIVMIVSIVFAVMFLVLAVIFLMGKGDMLIQDYRYQATKNCHGRPDGGNRRLLHHSASPRQ